MKRVAIIYGGPSNEHEVSISSAKNILKNIDKNKWEVLEIFIDKKGKFFIKNNDSKDKVTFSENKLTSQLKERDISKVFPILHGKYGEDGKIQKILERAGIDFVGSSSVSSSLAIDKFKANKVYERENILIPKSKILTKNNHKHNLNYPIIVKPIDEGSSFGLFKIDNEKDFLKKIDRIFSKNKRMLAQEFVSGREFTCGVLDIKNKIKVLSPSEIVLTKTKTFDYEAKYTKGAVKEITPAKIDKMLTRQIQELSKKCHKILGCKDISRTDMILSSDNKLYILETNTLPGMTQTSFIPEQAKVANIDIRDLIDILLS